VARGVVVVGVNLNGKLVFRENEFTRRETRRQGQEMRFACSASHATGISGHASPEFFPGERPVGEEAIAPVIQASP